jgi:hypothetical protein
MTKTLLAAFRIKGTISDATFGARGLPHLSAYAYSVDGEKSSIL